MVQEVSNARERSRSTGVQKLKYMARGFRNRDHLMVRNAYPSDGRHVTGSRDSMSG